MPICPLPSPRDLLESLKVEQLKERIRTLNSKGHSLTLAGYKQLLVDRVYYAENPNATPPTPNIPQSKIAEIDTQTAMAQTIVVDSETAKAYAASVVSSLNVLLKYISRVFDPNKENWKAQVSGAKKGLKEAVALEEQFAGPTARAIEHIKNRIQQYELAEQQKRQLEQRQIAVRTKQLAHDAMLDRVVELYDKGNYDEAERLERSISNGVLDRAASEAIARVPVTAPTKAKGVSTSFRWRWKITDVSKLEPRFTMTLADTAEIASVVKHHGQAACAIVGVGAIEVWQEANTRTTGH